MPQPDAPSVRNLRPGFVISAGTQVVLKVAKALSGGLDTKPPGTVGVVLESPPDNRQPCLIRFADAAYPEHRLEQREEESREAQARRRRKRAARRAVTAAQVMATL